MKKNIKIVGFLAICVLSLSLGGCEACGALIMGQVVEPRMTGPFLNRPDLTKIAESSPDQIPSAATSIYFLWTHPDASEGKPYACQIKAVTVQGIPPETMIGQVAGVSTANSIGGQIQFAMDAGTLQPGTYRADVSLDSTQFATVQFEVQAQ